MGTPEIEGSKQEKVESVLEQKEEVKKPSFMGLFKKKEKDSDEFIENYSTNTLEEIFAQKNVGQTQEIKIPTEEQKEKMDNIIEKQKELEQCRSQLVKKIETINHKLVELEKIIASIIIREDEESENMYSAENDVYSVLQNLNRINNRIKMCVDLVDVDRNRCKLELMNLSGYIDDILNEI